MAETKSLMYPNALTNADNCRVCVTCRSSFITCIKDILEKFLEDLDKPSRFNRRQLKKFENSCFVDVPPPPQSNRIRNTYFGNLKKIKNSNVRVVFLYLKRSKLEDKEDMVRFALIYFLECGLLGKESQVSIDIQHLSMVEDLKYLNKYIWGLESYNATISSMRRVLTLHDGELNESTTYSLSGFPQAFQEYHRPDTYENMPMNEEGEIRDDETNVMQNDSEV
ncbi:hypothetical protein FNV43_RR11078 [Rhamnella rubrinervis]|uniref:DUF1985 domain-containing protein n=1 Tax=Rhamnella rubrinervis TaxID=2594499 RepID=A0A8K0H560_9ROSA|nr:hypothetical protein FNV43_RR11078 [Rhamnella rubrinervis]